MNPSKCRMVGEDGASYTMHDGTSEFRVPKQGLSEKLHAQIRGMAHGGEVHGKTTSTSRPKTEAPRRPVPTVTVRMGEPEITRIPYDRPHSEDPDDSEYSVQMADGGTVDAGYDPMALPSRFGADVGQTAPLPEYGVQAPPTPAGLPNINVPVAPVAQDPINAHIDELRAKPSMHSKAAGDADEQVRATDYAAAQLPPGVRLKSSPAPEVKVNPAQPPPAPAAPRGPARAAGPLPGTVDYSNATDEQRAAVEAKGRAEAEAARASANAFAEGEKVLQSHQLEERRMAQQAHTQASDLMSRYEAAQADMRNVDTTVDPGRFWASRSTAQKVSGWIGLALGALGAGPGGINQVAVQLNQAIDRDIDAQKAEHTFRLQKGKAAVDAAQTMYGMNHQIFQDDLAASAGAKSTALDLINNKLQQVAATSNSDIAKAQAAALSARLLADKAKFDSDAANIAFDNQTQRITANAQSAAANAKTGGLDQKQKDIALDTNERNLNLQRNGSELLKMIDDYGTGELMTPGIEAKMRQKVVDMAIDAAKIKDPSSIVRPSEAAQEAENIFKPGWMQRTSSAKAAIQAFMDNNQARKNTGFEVRGLK